MVYILSQDVNKKVVVAFDKFLLKFQLRYNLYTIIYSIQNMDRKANVKLTFFLHQYVGADAST